MATLSTRQKKVIAAANKDSEKIKDSVDKFKEGEKFLNKSEAYRSNSDLEKAIQLFTEAITLIQGADQNQKHLAKFHCARGNAFMFLSQYQRAYFDFSTALRFEHKNPFYYVNIANCYQQLDRIEDALNAFSEAIKLKEEDGSFYINRALLHGRKNDFDSAIKDYRRALKYLFTPKDNAQVFKAYFSLGNCYRVTGDLHSAIECLMKAVEIERDNGAAYNNLGLAYFENLDYDKAVEEFQMATKLDGSNATYYNNLGLAFYHLDQLDVALDNFKASINLDPNEGRTYYNQGNAYVGLKEYDTAHEYFDKAISLDHKNSKFYHSKGLAYQDTQEYEKAIECFEKSLHFTKDIAASKYHLGIMYRLVKRLDEALQAFTDVIKQYGEDQLVYLNRGLVYQDMGDHILAIKDFNRAIQIEPNNSEAYFNRGCSRVLMSEYERAVVDYDKALELGSQNSGVYSWLGLTFQKLGNREKALYYMDIAISKNQNAAVFYVRRSDIYTEMKNHRGSISDLNRALDIQGEDAQVLYMRGLNFYCLEEYNSAIENLRRSVKHGIETDTGIECRADAYYHIGLSHARLEQFKEALEPYSLALELNPDETIYKHERAKAYLLTGGFDQALSDFTDVLKKQSWNAHAYFGRAFTYKAKKDFLKSAEDFEKAAELEPDDPNIRVNYKKIHEVRFIKLCEPGEEAL